MTEGEKIYREFEEAACDVAARIERGAGHSDEDVMLLAAWIETRGACEDE